MRKLYTNINKLLLIENEANIGGRVLGLDMDRVSSIEQAALLVENGMIHSYATMSELAKEQVDEVIDCKQGLVFPAFCDSHTHLVFATPRNGEFVARIKGKTYEEIAAEGGGILNSAARLQVMDEIELFDDALQRLYHAIEQGTGAIEIKSGYGLTVDAELKMLRVIRKLKEMKLIPVKASFLGAHAFPFEYKQNHEAYLNLLINEMLPRIAGEGLADYVDVFCEKGFFSVGETDQILTAAAKFGLKPKIHANQLHRSGGVQIGVQHGAISVDHLESMGDEEIECLKNSKTIATLLPGAAFFLNMHYQPARALIDANLPVAVASDFNPGSCPSSNMSFMMALCCTQMKMTPNEALQACTINGAAALELHESIGTIAKGKQANFVITKPLNELSLIPYFYGDMLIRNTVINGKII